MRNVTAVILGGGQGARLMPLTRDRAKPSVAFAGKYRIVRYSLLRYCYWAKMLRARQGCPPCIPGCRAGIR